MRIKKFPKFTKLLITWQDIKSNCRWIDIDDIVKNEKPAVIKTLGFFLSNKKRVLTVGHNVSDDNDSDFTVIPWGCIQDIKELEIK